MNTNGKSLESQVIVPEAVVTEEVSIVPNSVATNERMRLFALAALTVVLIGLCFWLSLPFLFALAWAVAFTVIAWPFHAWIKRHIPSPNLAALVSTLSVLFIIIVPILLVTYELIQEASSGVEKLKSQNVEMTLHAQLLKVPALREPVAWLGRMNIDFENQMQKLIMSFTHNASSLLSGSLMIVLQFAISLFILFHFLRDATVLRDKIRDFLPMTRQECDRVFDSVANSVRANIYAILTCSTIDAITGGLVFWALGLPSPVLWAVVVFLLVSILPMFGTATIWIPAAIVLLVTNQWQSAIWVMVWGITTSALIDNLLFVHLAGKRMHLHRVPAMLAFLGGIALFGPSGIILGPTILAVTLAVMENWRLRAQTNSTRLIVRGGSVTD